MWYVWAIAGMLAVARLAMSALLDAIAAGLHAHLDAGADHIAIQVLSAAGQDPMRAYQRLAHSLL